MIFMVMSSTTLASRKTGEPSPRAMTKSSISLLSKVGLATDQVDDHGLALVAAYGSAARASRPGARPRSRQKPS